MRRSQSQLLSTALTLAAAAPGQQAAPQTCAPDPFVCMDGTRVESAEQWRTKRRPEVLELFRRQVYGRTPKTTAIRIEAAAEGPALEGLATRKQWQVRYGDAPDATIHVLAYLPARAEGPAPVFLALNFDGNQTVSDDPAVPVTARWVRNRKRYDIADHRSNEDTRGSADRRYPLEDILGRGFGLVTAYYGDIDPDYDDGFANGAHGAIDPERDGPRPPDAWGAIGAWAWGLSRILDSLERDDDVDHARVAVLGHSRLGKTALWAGAQDERFALVVSNDSGCGGAAYFRRKKGETVAAITHNFPHWFCRTFRSFAGKEEQLPVDQHLLIALCAPRPVYVASAANDLWADPEGEYRSTAGADPVYRLLCGDGLPPGGMPAVGATVQGRLGYHIRSGDHDLLAEDWEHYLDFAARHLQAGRDKR